MFRSRSVCFLLICCEASVLTLLGAGCWGILIGSPGWARTTACAPTSLQLHACRRGREEWISIGCLSSGTDTQLAGMVSPFLAGHRSFRRHGLGLLVILVGIGSAMFFTYAPPRLANPWGLAHQAESQHLLLMHILTQEVVLWYLSWCLTFLIVLLILG